MTDEEKIQVLGEKQIELFDLFNRVINLIGNMNDRLERLEHRKSKDNEVTYLHNEINEIKKVLGLDGSVPTRRTGDNL